MDLYWIVNGTQFASTQWDTLTVISGLPGLYSSKRLGLHSVDARFESRPWYRISWLKCFVLFLGPSQQISGQYVY
jgi:hypothetical protein